MGDLNSLKETLIDEQVGWAMIYTQEFGPNLQNQARVSVKNIIENIYQKAMIKWKRLQSDSTIEEAAQDMLKKLKEVIFQAKRTRSSLSNEEFDKHIEHHIAMARPTINDRFLKTKDQ